jgi:hypothetical protein
MKAMSISQCSTCFERSIAPRDPSGGGSWEGGVMIRGAMMAMYDGRWDWHRDWRIRQWQHSTQSRAQRYGGD